MGWRQEIRTPEGSQGMSIGEWSITLEQVEWSPVQSILRGETQELSSTEAFGQFDANKSLESMSNMVNEKEVRKHAPRFLELIYGVTKLIKQQGQEDKTVRNRLIKPARSEERRVGKECLE